MSIGALAAAVAEAMAAEAAAYDTMLDLAESQRVALEANDLDRLDRITEEQIEAVAALTRLEAHRAAAAARLAAALGIPTDWDLRQIIAALPDAEAAPLGFIGDRLRRLVDQIERISERNKAMLVNGLRTSQFLIRTVLGSTEPEQVYARNGRVGDAVGDAALEFRA